MEKGIFCILHIQIQDCHYKLYYIQLAIKLTMGNQGSLTPISTSDPLGWSVLLKYGEPISSS